MRLPRSAVETPPAMPAAHLTLRALTYLAAQRGPVTAAAVQEALGSPRAATFRMLNALVHHGYAIHYPEQRRYGLGYAAFELSSGFARQEPLTRLALPILSRLVDELGETAHLAVLHGTDVIYLIEQRAPHRPALITDIGVRLPAAVTASGRAMLSRLPRPQLRALFSGGAPPDRNERGTGYGQLVSELAVVRRMGYAVEDENVSPGFASVAVAVADHAGWPAASITVTLPRSRYASNAWPEVAMHVAPAAAELARRIGGSAASGVAR